MNAGGNPTALEFFAALFPVNGADRPGLIELRPLPSLKRAFIEPGDWSAIDRFVQNHRHEDVYFGPAARIDSQNGGGKDNCGLVRAVYADIDFKTTPEEEARRALTEFPFGASIVVSSGGGYHPYWLLSEPVDLRAEGDRFESILRRLAAALHADPSCAECARILRVPGSLNHKPEYGTPRKVRIIHFAADRLYELSDFDDFLAPEPEPEKPQVSQTPKEGTGTRPGDLFNQRATWEEILEPAGWKTLKTHGEETYIYRPGIDTSHTATVNYKGSGLLYMFSSDAAPFKEHESYSKFWAYTLLHHKGDKTAAVKALVALGYGTNGTQQPGPEQPPPITEDPEFLREQGKRVRAEGQPAEEPKPFTPPAHWIMRDVAEVRSWPCKPIEWVIEGIAARGNLVWIAADTQTGKTLIGFYNALQMPKGGLLYGRFKVNPVKRILYLVLEDPERRIKDRILDILHGMDPAIDPGVFSAYFASGLNIADDLQMSWLDELVADYEVIYLDTYQRSTPGIASFDDAKQSLIVHKLVELTRKHNVLLFVHDHFRKPDTKNPRRDPDKGDVKGTGGKVQNADCVITMDKAGDRIRVKVESKENSTVYYFMLEVSPEGSDGEKYTFVGDLEQMAGDMKKIGDANRMKVFEAIPADGSETSRDDICRNTGLKARTVNKHLAALVAAAQVRTNGKESTAIRYGRAQASAHGETVPCALPVSETLPFN